MQWLLLSLMLGVSWVPQNQQYLNGNVISNSCFKQDIQIEALVADVLNVYSTTTIWDYARSAVSFTPFRADFTIGAELRWKWFSLGVSHLCAHPVIYNVEGQPLGYGANTTELYLRFRSTWRP